MFEIYAPPWDLNTTLLLVVLTGPNFLSFKYTQAELIRQCGLDQINSLLWETEDLLDNFHSNKPLLKVFGVITLYRKTDVK